MTVPVPPRKLAVLFSLCIMLSAYACAGGPPPDAVDLTLEEWRVKRGFSADDAAGFPPGQGLAAKPPLYPEQLFEWRPPEPGRRQARHYTVEVSFDLLPQTLSEQAWGLKLGAIGQAWEIYLNGKHMAGEIEQASDGELEARQRRNDYLIAIPSGMLKPSLNTLVFHLAGDPSPTPFTRNFALGFYKTHGYVVAPYDDLTSQVGDLLDAALLSIFIFAGLFSLGIAALSSQERTLTLTFGLTAIGLFVFLVTRDPYVLNRFGDTSLLYRISFAGGAAGTSAALIFAHRFAFDKRRYRLYEQLYLALSIFLLFWFFVAPFPTLFAGIRLWHFTTLAALGVLLGEVTLSAAVKHNARARMLMPVIIVPILALMWDVANSIAEFSPLRLAEHGFVAMILGIGIIAMAAYLRTYRRSEKIHRALQKSKNRMESLNRAAIEAFCLREGNAIVGANPAFCNLFTIKEEDLIRTPFSRLFVASDAERILPALEVDNTPIEARAITATGEVFPAEFVSRTYDMGRQRVKVTAVRDIRTRQRETERLLARNKELQALTDKMVERELAMVDLKRQIKQIKKSAASEP